MIWLLLIVIIFLLYILYKRQRDLRQLNVILNASFAGMLRNVPSNKRQENVVMVLDELDKRLDYREHTEVMSKLCAQYGFKYIPDPETGSMNSHDRKILAETIVSAFYR